MDIFGGEARYFLILTDDSRMGVNEKFFFGEMLLRRAEELIIERNAFVEVFGAVLKKHIPANSGTETFGTFEHSREDDEGDEHYFLVMPDRTKGECIVLRLIVSAGGRKDICVHEMRGVHHAYNGNLNRHIVHVEMGLHGV